MTQMRDNFKKVHEWPKQREEALFERSVLDMEPGISNIFCLILQAILQSMEYYPHFILRGLVVCSDHTEEELLF